MNNWYIVEIQQDKFTVKEDYEAGKYYMYLPLYYHVGVFILRARRLKHESFSSRQVFYVDVQVK